MCEQCELSFKVRIVRTFLLFILMNKNISNKIR
nr:MAG TPA: hypothetical protein [Caudoviricetes sp.]